MYEAEVGDDVLGEDPSVNALEAYAAELVGKEAALFVPSGTFGNQLALFTHCTRGEEVILDEQCHIVQHEAGAAAVIAGVQLRTLTPRGVSLSWPDIEPHIRKEQNIHYPRTGLIELENALSNGEVLPLEEMEEIRRQAQPYGIPIHLDGARIFNAAAYLGMEAARIAGLADSLMFCLSKGLSAPVGSVVAGKRDFVERARRGRKIMGGGMRQAGVLAAAGLVALKEMVPRLAEDRAKAERLAAAFRECGLFTVRPEKVKINMLFVRFNAAAYAGKERALVEALGRYEIITYPPEEGWIRFVTHSDVSTEQVAQVCARLEQVVEELG